MRECEPPIVVPGAIGALAGGRAIAGSVRATSARPPITIGAPTAFATVIGAVTYISAPGTRAFGSSWLPGYFAVIVAASPTVPD